MTQYPKQSKADKTDKKYQDWLKTQPCCNCGNEPIEGVRDVVPAHQNNGYGCMGGKGEDRSAVPLCVLCHSKEHNGRKTFWGDTDVKAIISRLNNKYENNLK